MKDKELTKQVTAVWGTLREGRNPASEKMVRTMRDFLRKTPGDAKAGMVVFKNLCGQCHKIHGEGQEVGPDLTSNGRSDFEQLLSNVFDPSLVIGAGYVATTVATKKGQVITGLVVEDNVQRVVLKIQGGKLETIARGRHRRDGGQQGIVDAGGIGEAAQAAGDRRPVRFSLPRQIADRSVSEADSGVAEFSEVKGKARTLRLVPLYLLLAGRQRRKPRLSPTGASLIPGSAHPGRYP